MIGDQYSTTVDYDPSGATFNLTNTGAEAIVIAKYDNNGDFICALMQTPGHNETTRDRQIAVSGSIVNVITYFDDGSIDFDPCTGTTNVTAYGDYDIAIAKYDFSACNCAILPAELDFLVLPFNTPCFGSGGGSAEVTINSGVAPFTYAWYDSLTNTQLAGSDSIISGLLEGNYYVVVVDDSSIVDTQYFNITYNSIPTVNILEDTILVGFGYSSTISTIFSSQGDISWSPSTNLDNDTIQNPTVTPIDSGWYSVSFNDTLGCLAIDSVYIIVIPCEVEVDIVLDRGLVEEGEGVLVEVEYSDLSTDIVWTPNQGIDNVNGLEPVISPEESMFYYALFTNLVGCSATDSIYIEVNPSCIFYVPTAFTPDGDGNNDFWNLICFDEEPNAFLKVFNRWGGLVYESNGGADFIPWDGKNNGKELPVGTYYYTIEGLSLDSEFSNGIVTIIK